MDVKSNSGFRLIAQRRAFTLVEIVIVVLVMGIMGKVALSSFLDNWHRQRVAAAARRVIEDIRYAASHAQNASANQSIVFSTTLHKYSLSGLTHPDHAELPYEVNLFEQYSTSILSASFGGNSTLTFSTSGLPSASGSIVLKSGTSQTTIWLTSGGRLTTT